MPSNRLRSRRRGHTFDLVQWEMDVPREAVFTLDLDPELRDQFVAEAEALHRPPSQLLRELMGDFVRRQREAREYDDSLRHKVEKARASIAAGHGRSNEEVAAEFAARRQGLVQSGEA